MRLRLVFIGMLSATCLVNAANAANIDGLWNTGVDSAGTAYSSDGASELHYLVNGTPTAVAYKHPAWLGVGDAYWIAAAPGGAYGANPNSYTLTFDLTGFDLATASIGGGFAADDQGSVRLNGGAVISTTSTFSSLTSFNFTSGFVAGINTLTFSVLDTGGVPSGLLVSGLHGTADVASGAVPEPASWALMLVGFGAVGSAMRRRQRTAVSFG